LKKASTRVLEEANHRMGSMTMFLKWKA